jgi:hypothetical protein
LDEDIDTISAFPDHLLDPGKLAFDPIQAGKMVRVVGMSHLIDTGMFRGGGFRSFGLGGRHTSFIPPGGYIVKYKSDSAKT